MKLITRSKVVAWFKIGNVTTSSSEPKDGEEPDIWGGVASVDAASTKMEMNGSEQGKTPAPTSSAWQYYLGAKRPPAGTNRRTLAIEELPTSYISALRRRRSGVSQKRVRLGDLPSQRGFLRVFPELYLPLLWISCKRSLCEAAGQPGSGLPNCRDLDAGKLRAWQFPADF